MWRSKQSGWSSLLSLVSLRGSLLSILSLALLSLTPQRTGCAPREQNPLTLSLSAMVRTSLGLSEILEQRLTERLQQEQQQKNLLQRYIDDTIELSNLYAKSKEDLEKSESSLALEKKEHAATSSLLDDLQGSYNKLTKDFADFKLLRDADVAVVTQQRDNAERSARAMGLLASLSLPIAVIEAVVVALYVFKIVK